MNAKYKENERIMKNIICNNVSYRWWKEKLNLLRSTKKKKINKINKTENLLMKKSP